MKVTRLVAIILAMPLIGCSYGSGLLGPGLTAPPTPAEEAADDKSCQSTGYQLGSPAYDQCRKDLSRQRLAAEHYQATPINMGQR